MLSAVAVTVAVPSCMVDGEYADGDGAIFLEVEESLRLSRTVVLPLWATVLDVFNCDTGAEASKDGRFGELEAYDIEVLIEETNRLVENVIENPTLGLELVSALLLIVLMLSEGVCEEALESLSLLADGIELLPRTTDPSGFKEP